MSEETGRPLTELGGGDWERSVTTFSDACLPVPFSVPLDPRRKRIVKSRARKKVSLEKASCQKDHFNMEILDEFGDPGDSSESSGCGKH